MAHTDKDTPDWVVLNDPDLHTVEVHSYKCQRGLVPCDIDQSFTDGRTWEHCRYNIRLDTPEGRRFHRPRLYVNVPSEDIRLAGRKPERQAARRALRNLLAYAQYDEDFDDNDAPVQRDHRGPWGGGYWD